MHQANSCSSSSSNLIPYPAVEQPSGDISRGKRDADQAGLSSNGRDVKRIKEDPWATVTAIVSGVASPIPQDPSKSLLNFFHSFNALALLREKAISSRSSAQGGAEKGERIARTHLLPEPNIETFLAFLNFSNVSECEREQFVGRYLEKDLIEISSPLFTSIWERAVEKKEFYILAAICKTYPLETHIEKTQQLITAHEEEFLEFIANASQVTFSSILHFQDAGITLPEKTWTVRDSRGISVLEKASGLGLLSLLTSLIERGYVSPERDSSALPFAAFHGQKEIVQLLLAKGFDCNATTSSGETALMPAACKGYDEVLDLLLAQAHIDVNKVSPSGKSAVLLAFLNNHVAIAKKLLARGASLDFKDSHGDTPLIKALRHLVAKERQLAASKSSQPPELCSSGTAATRPLLSPTNPAFAPTSLSSNSTPSNLPHQQILSGKEMALVLLEHGASATIPGKGGVLPIHLAAEAGSIEILRLLIPKMTDNPFACDDNGRSFLFYACESPSPLKEFWTELSELPRKMQLAHFKREELPEQASKCDTQGNTLLHHVITSTKLNSEQKSERVHCLLNTEWYANEEHRWGARSKGIVNPRIANNDKCTPLQTAFIAGEMGAIGSLLRRDTYANDMECIGSLQPNSIDRVDSWTEYSSPELLQALCSPRILRNKYFHRKNTTALVFLKGIKTWIRGQAPQTFMKNYVTLVRDIGISFVKRQFWECFHNGLEGIDDLHVTCVSREHLKHKIPNVNSSQVNPQNTVYAALKGLRFHILELFGSVDSPIYKSFICHIGEELGLVGPKDEQVVTPDQILPSPEVARAIFFSKYTPEAILDFFEKEIETDESLKTAFNNLCNKANSAAPPLSSREKIMEVLVKLQVITPGGKNTL